MLALLLHAFRSGSICRAPAVDRLCTCRHLADQPQRDVRAEQPPCRRRRRTLWRRRHRHQPSSTMLRLFGAHVPQCRPCRRSIALAAGSLVAHDAFLSRLFAAGVRPELRHAAMHPGRSLTRRRSSFRSLAAGARAYTCTLPTTDASGDLHAAENRRPDGPCFDRSRSPATPAFALSLEAQRRGHQLFHYTPDRLSLRDGKVFARIEAMQLRDEKGNHFTLGEPVRTDLSEMDVVLLRQDPPFDMNYITTTHILERIHPKTLVVNDPAWVRNSPEKIFVTEFPDLMPETLITKDRAGGRGASARNSATSSSSRSTAMAAPASSICTRPTAISPRCSKCSARCSASRSSSSATCKEVRKGDKRIILIDGEAGRRHQPRAGRARFALQHACRRPRREDRADGRASARSAPASARR